MDLTTCTSNDSDLKNRTLNLENYLGDQKNTVTVSELEQTVALIWHSMIVRGGRHY